MNGVIWMISEYHHDLGHLHLNTYRCLPALPGDRNPNRLGSRVSGEAKVMETSHDGSHGDGNGGWHGMAQKKNKFVKIRVHIYILIYILGIIIPTD